MNDNSTKYRFVPVEDDTRERLLELRSELVCVDEDALTFAEPPFDSPDRAKDLVKHESPHDPHRSPERKLDSTVRQLIQLARTHPETDIEVSTKDTLDLRLLL
jgi:hypothetical protein